MKNLVLLILVGLAACQVEHATDIEIHQVEVTEIPWSSIDKFVESLPPFNTEQPSDAEGTTTETPTTTISAKLTEADAPEENGEYYVYHPEGFLQRIVYATKDDPQKMEYTAQLKYQDVEPIRSPVYTYDPETLALIRLNK
ncbi:unnamed protein product [Acanthoscelides obtectus]|uniref:Uncharacterized protein n=1 Tax=Acanthoscelides obtectus TaxID=200917 RepID=A0A9P0KFQ5_ACAOB|nr:unnamed protein product [Acanthoscelides obtectus]CAK1668754.1 hypothetical protein AOBTE_LOCUS26586 [Acanthoscelides obtectus]